MYYDGANWKWGDGVTSFTCYPGGKMVNGKEVTEKEFKKSLDAWCGVKEKGDEMRLRFIDRDGKKILQQEVMDTEHLAHWEDVPCVEEKKEQRKMAVILKNAEGHCWTHEDLAKATIDAVIECYEEWDDLFIKHRKPFPEYLKEKLGNEKEKML